MEAPRMAVWLMPEQVELVADVAALAGLAIVAAGSPARGHSGAVASRLGAGSMDDLRSGLATVSADLFLIAAPGSFGAGPGSDDTGAVLAAHGRGVAVATLEPIPAVALDLASAGWISGSAGVRPVDVLRFCPLARLAAPFREAIGVLESFGPVRTVAVEAWCGPAEGSLGARLFSAMELVLALLGEPETVDAAYVSPRTGGALHVLPGESLRDLHGDITANLRFADGRAAAIVASDRGGRWNRGATILGDGGRLRVFDDGFEWIGPGGERVDESRSGSGRGEDRGVSHAVEAIAEGLARLVDQSVPDAGPTDHATILAMGQAALLSARTGQGESPATIKMMVRAG